jgi:hypothetical protein
MIEYKTTKYKSERVIMLAAESSCGYGHINAIIVRRALPDVVNPDTGHREYNDGDKDAYGFRNCSWSSTKDNALYVEDLVIRNQFDTASDKPSYGHGARFMNKYSVELDEAEYMVQTLKTIGKKLNAINDEYGYVDDYASYVIRIAKIFGIKTFVVAKEKGTPFVSKNYREFGVANVKWEIEQLEDSVRTVKTGD